MQRAALSFGGDDMADRERFIELAEDWLARGAELVPAQPGSKHLIAGFGARQAHIATSADVITWLGERQCNFGVVLGRLACLDFDTWQAYGDWRHGPGYEVRTLIERTSRGAHVFFELASPAKTMAGPGFEFKTSGVVMCAPSVHPSGGVYSRLTDFPIPLLAASHLPISFPLSSPARPSSKRAWPDRSGTCPTLKPATGAQGSLLARIKAAVKLTDLLPSSVQLTGAGRYQSARCPFHDDRRASFWIDTERQLWGCMAMSCPQHGTHDSINLFAALNGCDVRRAIRALVKDYGLG
jgi:hypothetical protein